jgi:hypothetical protein
MPENDAPATERRKLRFASIDEVIADVDGLVRAETSGTLRRIGNWTLGQTLGHLAAWAGFCYEGYPIKPPRVIGWILRLRRHAFIHGPMRAGVRIPGVKGGTVATEALSTVEGHERFRHAMQRLKDERAMDRHPFLGKMTQDEWIALNLRHAELHLSFLWPS